MTYYSSCHIISLFLSHPLSHSLSPFVSSAISSCRVRSILSSLPRSQFVPRRLLRSSRFVRRAVSHPRIVRRVPAPSIRRRHRREDIHKSSSVDAVVDQRNGGTHSARMAEADARDDERAEDECSGARQGRVRRR